MYHSLIQFWIYYVRFDAKTHSEIYQNMFQELSDPSSEENLILYCKMDGNLVLDLGDYEDKKGEADVPLAYMPKLEEVTLLQMDGILTQKETEDVIEMAISGCKQIYEIQRDSLKKKYGMIEKDDESLEDELEEPEETEASEEPSEEPEHDEEEDGE